MPDRRDRQLAHRGAALHARRAVLLGRAAGAGGDAGGRGGGRRDRGARGRGRGAARGGAQGPRRQGGGAGVRLEADGQPLQPQQAGTSDRRRQFPPHRQRRRERRPPHHPRFPRDAVPGARRPEHRHPAAGPRRQGRSPPGQAVLGREPARRREAERQQRLAHREARGAAASARIISATCRRAPRST